MIPLQTRLHSYYLNPALVCCQLVACAVVFYWLAIDTHIHLHQHHDSINLLCGWSFGLSLLGWAFHLHRWHRLHESPVTTIQAAPQGYVELQGNTEARLPLSSPIQGKPCVWYRHWVYAKTSQGVWQLQHYQTSHHIFGLRDHSGVCEVDPEGAEVIAAERYQIRQHDHRYIEDILAVDTPLYLLGELDSMHRPASEAALWKEANQLVTAWKDNPIKLKQRFDQNLDGQIDLNEWERARQEAYAEVQRKYDPKHHTEQMLIRKPRATNRLYLLSGISPHELRARFRFWTLWHGIFMAMFLYFLIVH